MSNESHFLAGRRGVGIIVLGLGFGGTTVTATSDAASVLGGWLRRSITRVSASPQLLSSEPLLSVKDSTFFLSGTFEFSAREGGAIFFRPLLVGLMGSMSRGCFIFGCRAGDSQHFTLFRPAFNDFCDSPLSMSSNL